MPWLSPWLSQHTPRQSKTKTNQGAVSIAVVNMAANIIGTHHIKNIKTKIVMKIMYKIYSKSSPPKNSQFPAKWDRCESK